MAFWGWTEGAGVVDDDNSFISGSIEIVSEGAIEVICCFVQSITVLSSKVA